MTLYYIDFKPPVYTGNVAKWVGGWNGIWCLDSRPLCLLVEQPLLPKVTPWSGGSSPTFEYQDPEAPDGILQRLCGGVFKSIWVFWSGPNQTFNLGKDQIHILQS